MNILCIECSTEVCSVALIRAEQVSSRELVAPRKHNELVLDLATQLLDQQDMARTQLDAIAFSRGPGAFTGVRIAASIAQAIGLALDRPLISVSTLDVLAQRAFERGGYGYALPVMDARMGEVYWTVCERDEHGLAVRRNDERVGLPESVQVELPGKCIGIGSGWKHYPQLKRLLSQVDVDSETECWLPSAVHLASLARREWQLQNLLLPEQALPVYVRNEVVSR